MGFYHPRNMAHRDQFATDHCNNEKGLYCYDQVANLRWKVCNPEPGFPIVPGGVILAPVDGVVRVRTFDGRVGVAVVHWP